IVDAPLAGLADNAVLNDVATGEPIGTVDGFETDFFVSLDSAIDFQKGDVVTVDVTTHAVITKVEATAVTLDGPISGVAQGNALTLANALPVLRPEGAGASG